MGALLPMVLVTIPFFRTHFFSLLVDTRLYVNTCFGWNWCTCSLYMFKLGSFFSIPYHVCILLCYYFRAVLLCDYQVLRLVSFGQPPNPIALGWTRLRPRRLGHANMIMSIFYNIVRFLRVSMCLSEAAKDFHRIFTRTTGRGHLHICGRSHACHAIP
jgi:hypothetical protein